jgi:hypothetical protein
MMFNAIAGIIGIQWYFHGGITDGRIIQLFSLAIHVKFRSQVRHAEPRVGRFHNLSTSLFEIRVPQLLLCKLGISRQGTSRLPSLFTPSTL